MTQNTNDSHDSTDAPCNDDKLPPDRDAGEYRSWFPAHPETIIEAVERLGTSEDAYERYLASELADAYEQCPDDLSAYRGVGALHAEDDKEVPADG